MVLYLDEAGVAEETELVEAIYALGNGGEKMRATRDARERTTSKYNLVALVAFIGESENAHNVVQLGHGRHVVQTDRTRPMMFECDCPSLYPASVAPSGCVTSVK